MMDKVEAIASAMGVPPLALVPIALLAMLALVFILDGLSHVVLKPFKSPPVIATMPLVGGMAAFLRGPIGLMASSFPKYGEVFTGMLRELFSDNITVHVARPRDPTHDAGKSSPRPLIATRISGTSSVSTTPWSCPAPAKALAFTAKYHLNETH
jgi:hypothetical protein|tara:strand:+ start:797 stop:1258 length:462 start_codon:yes stop_codon:yes gene_type:complete|mmetsp:Transcript_15960/g.52372  ORF Transcript_15960/g.52372 Transcript_15960/m.52372 type:complete len:154 (-) Transcript_15960:1399-1860(-)